MNVPGLVSALVNVASLLVFAHGAWWSLLSLIAIPRPGRHSHQSSQASFAVVVPAHNEELRLPATLRSLAKTTYTPSPRVLVVADNCDDRTAAVARDHGVDVIERHDPVNRGKGYALDFAIDHLRAGGTPPSIVVFIDADSEVNGAFFGAMANHFAHSNQPAQAYYQAAPGETSLARLREVAFRLLHWSRPLGASRLGLPTTVKGNGMAMRWELARDGLGAAGIAEDADLTLRFAEKGMRFEFVAEAVVTGQMAQTYRDARTQDERWEAGRWALQRRALRVAFARTARGDLPGAAAALEVASLPLSLLALLSAVLIVLTTTTSLGSTPLAMAAGGTLAVYVVIGGIAARFGPREILALAAAPRFLLHKASVYLRLVVRRGPTEWKRTAR